MVSAVRELREETGYAGENARVLGRIYANPAILTNITRTRIHRKLPLATRRGIRSRRRP